MHAGSVQGVWAEHVCLAVAMLQHQAAHGVRWGTPCRQAATQLLIRDNWLGLVGCMQQFEVFSIVCSCKCVTGTLMDGWKRRLRQAVHCMAACAADTTRGASRRSCYLVSRPCSGRGGTRLAFLLVDDLAVVCVTTHSPPAVYCLTHCPVTAVCLAAVFLHPLIVPPCVRMLPGD